ncbi:hypothetical protein [Streptomyces sp. 150FB]|uniref:hypothetical protein n=1 Tax=Streptomyces sp. 150FB TaxID=1576605 RepID=UPI0012378082|nr:hypothetical protein [Streptomyces sp. 150FB]
MTKWILVSTAGAVALCGLVACSGEGQKYEIPKKLCDAPVDNNLLKPLLPDGRKVETLKEFSKVSPPHQFCDVMVDGDIDLSTEGIWQKSGFTAKDAAKQTLVFNTRSTQHGTFEVWDTGAITVFDCKTEKWNTPRYSLRSRYSLRVYAPRTEENLGDQIERFLTVYAKEYRKTLHCQP